MATPHVAGLVAYLIAKDGNASPAELSEKVRALSSKGVLTGIRTSFYAHNLRKSLAEHLFDSYWNRQLPRPDWTSCLGTVNRGV
jgi:subtilisin family serine protease